MTGEEKKLLSDIEQAALDINVHLELLNHPLHCFVSFLSLFFFAKDSASRLILTASS